MISKFGSFLVIAFLISMLAFSSSNPTVQALESTVQEKALSVLSDIVGLKTEYYTIALSTQSDTLFGGLDQKESLLRLTSNGSSLRISCSFVSNQLREVYLSESQGTLLLKQSSANTIEMANGLLKRYQNFSQNALYGDLASMISDVDENRNMTKLAGNMKIEVRNLNQKIIDYTWTYVDKNGMAAERKNVVLSFEKGQLKVFLNNWELYNVASVPKFTAQEAEEIAVEASKGFSYKAITANGSIETVTGIKIEPKSLGHGTLVYLNFKDPDDARGGDPFTLYPCWYLPLGFDKFYPGDVSSMVVTIWADTGEVASMHEIVADSGLASFKQETVTLGDNTVKDERKDSTLLGSTLVAAIVFCILGVSTCTMRKKYSFRIKYSRVWATLMCLSSLTVVLLFAVSSANATIPIPISKSRVYSCEDGEGYYNSQADENEKAAATNICNYIGNMTEDADYSTSNLHGTGTVASNVVSNAGFDEQNYHRTTVFHCGHLYGGQLNVAYQDNFAYPITESAVYAATGLGKHFFVFIWVCAQAEDETYGTPVAWTHRDNAPGRPYMSSDGYANPDGSGQCYIGFSGQSPMLSEVYPDETFYDCGDLGPSTDFIESFYDYALTQNYSVKNSLNRASLDYFGCSFSSSKLNGGYDSWWPGGDLFEPMNNSGYYPRDFNWYFNPDKPQNRMRVFGDGDIHLNQYNLIVDAKDQYNNYFSGKDVYIDLQHNIANTGSELDVSEGLHTIFVNDFWEAGFTGYRYTFQYYTYPGATYYANPAEWYIGEDWVRTAHFSKAYCPGDADGDGNTDQDDWTLFNDAYVSQRGDSNYNSACDFNCDGYVNSADYNHLYSILWPPYWITVTTSPAISAGVYIDSQYVGPTGNSFQVSYGIHDVSVADPVGYYSFHNFGGYPAYENPVEVNSATTLTAYYDYEPPNYYITVNANPAISANVYIDSVYVGTTGNSFEVTYGSHDVGVSETVGDYSFHNFGGYSAYENPVEVSSATTLTAYYDYNPSSYYITVNSNPSISAGVYIDSQYVGTTGNSFEVSYGSHDVSVADPVGDYTFHYFGGYDEYENPVEVSSAVTLTAYYDSPPEGYYITVTCSDQYGSLDDAGVYIDDELCGYSGDAIYVDAGNHYVSVDSEVYNGGWGTAHFYYFDGWDLQETPILISTEADITAYYWYFK